MAITDYIDHSVSVGTTGLARTSFGTGLIKSYTAAWTERVRSYTDEIELAVDFGATTAEYLAGAAYFAQDPKPSKLKVGRCALKPAYRWSITVASVANSTDYTAYFDGTAYTYTSDATATNDEIANGLQALLDAAADSAATTTGGAGSLKVQMLSSTAGAYHYMSVADPALLTITMNHADPGAATDLAAIAVEDSDWYCLIETAPSELVIAANAGWVETASKFYLAGSQDTEIVTVATGSATDAAKDNITASNVRTVVLYHPKQSEWFDAALTGMFLARDPGKATLAFKRPAGVDSYTLTSTHRTNAVAKYATILDPISSTVSWTFDGKAGSGRYADITRDLDWVASEMRTEIADALANNDKLPYTDDGIAAIGDIIKAVLDRAVTEGVFADGSTSVTVPTAASQSAANKTARTVTGLKYQATLAGAIHKAIVRGNVEI